MQAQHHLIHPANHAYLQNPNLTPKVSIGHDWLGLLLFALMIVVAAVEGYFLRRFFDHLDQIGGGGVRWGLRLFTENPEWSYVIIPGVLAILLALLLLGTAWRMAKFSHRRQLLSEGKVVTGKLIAVNNKFVTYWLRSPMTGLNLEGKRKLTARGREDMPKVDAPVAVLYLDDQNHAVL